MKKGNNREHTNNNWVVKKAEKKLQDRIKELSAIYKTSKSIISAKDVKEILDLIVRKTYEILGCDGSLIYLYNSVKNSYFLKSSKYKNKSSISNFIKLPLSGNENIFCQKEILNTKTFFMVNDISKLTEKISNNLKKMKIGSFISIPLLRDGKVTGLFVNYSKISDYFNKDDIRIITMFSKQAAVAIQNAKLLKDTQLSYLNTVKTLANIIEIKDSSTFGHSERVMARALAIADEMGLSFEEKKLLRFASFLHDIGKIDIDVSILRKPDPLDSKEWEIIKEHPEIGAKIVNGIEFLEDLAPIILHHHARYEGGGYPDPNMKSDKIPLCARILAVADAYESMINDRPYRKALSKQEAIKELKLNSGTQFDPKIINVLLKILSKE